MAPKSDWVQFQVLGTLEIAHHGRSVHIGGPQLRLVLARLLVDAGHRVSVGALVDELWGENTPPDADRTARTYVSRLRRVLKSDGEELLVTVPGGYMLRPELETVDATRFEQLAASGRRALAAGDPTAAARDLGAALVLWRGEAYAEFGNCPTLAAEGTRLDRLRLAAVEDQIAASLALGLHGDLVDDLEALVRAYPWRERLWGQLMVALYRSGRQAEALTAYRQARTLLIDEHGVDPSPELARLYHQVLNHDPALAGPTTPEPRLTVVANNEPMLPVPPVVEDVMTPVPAQLPIGVRVFAGRRGELARLDNLLPGSDPATTVTVAVSGTAGVGKTSLAVHWGWRVARHFPDGQLYVNLRGFAGGPSLDPAEALRRFLEAFGLPAEQLPSDLDARAALYRSVLAGRRVLVVLDNARDAEQVRPLLPASPGTMAVVTSRTSLGGLVAAEGAHRMPLDVLSPDEARELLAGRLGPDAVRAGGDHVEEIIARCARLPLALAIASARPTDTLAGLAAELRASAGALDAFEILDEATSVQSVFSWSYNVLSDRAARVFRLLGAQPCPELSEAATASLAHLDPRAARAALRELVDANLLAEHGPGRFAGHDLLRLYAAECATTVDSEADRRAAVRRLVDHLTHTAYAADREVYPHRTPIVLDPPAEGVVVPPLADAEAAWAWLQREHQSLQAIQQWAVEHEWGTAAWQLAWATSTLHQRRGRPQDMHKAWDGAVRANPDLDPSVQIMMLRHLAEACSRLGRFVEADVHLRRAVALAEAGGLLSEHAHVQRTLARLWSRRGDDAVALGHARRALELFRRCSDNSQVAAAANAVGWYAARVGDSETAQPHLQLALTLSRQLGDRLVEAHTLHSLGYLAQQTGRHDKAVRLLGRCLRLSRQNGDVYNEASTLDSLGDSHAALGQRDRARQHWQQAKELCEAQSRLADADRVRHKLERLPKHGLASTTPQAS